MNGFVEKSLSLSLCLVVFMSGCITNQTVPTNTTLPTILTGNIPVVLPSDEERRSMLISLTKEISNLPRFDSDTVETAEKYKELADRVNDVIKFLNREGGFNLELLKGTADEWEQLSHVINKYGPLVGNYNRVIDASKNFDINNESAVKEFYVSSFMLGLESGLIYYSVYHGPVFEATGYIYRATGLNRIAFACPTCVSVILSGTYWFIRDKVLEAGNYVAELFVSDFFSNLIKDGVKMPSYEDLMKIVNVSNPI